MNADIKNQWIAALRSGRYSQARHQLKTEQGHCCLGVLCELAVKAGIIDVPDEYHQYDGQSALLPQRVINWANMPGPIDYAVVQQFYRLSTINDCGTAFEQIADIIEKEL